MVLDDIQKGASNPIVPFIGKVDANLATATGIVGGFALLAALRPAGENLGDMAVNTFTSVTGINPQTGSTDANGPAFGGA